MTRLFAGTEFDREPRCETCDRPDSECVCPPAEKVWADPSKQTARVQVEKRSRGKRVTVVRGLSPDETDLSALLSDLKAAVGGGGAIKDDTPEVQGDHAAKVAEFLRGRGYKVR